MLLLSAHPHEARAAANYSLIVSIQTVVPPTYNIINGIS
jgi:hypothetical protein